MKRQQEIVKLSTRTTKGFTETPGFGRGIGQRGIYIPVAESSEQLRLPSTSKVAGLCQNL